MPKETKYCQCPDCRTPRTTPSLGRLTTMAEHMQRNFIFLSYGKVCELCGAEASCLDHCFSRVLRQYFFDLDNLTRLCAPCHRNKTKQWHFAHLKVFDLVKEKCGEKKFNKMWLAGKNKTKPWPKWNRQYVESMLNKYRKLIDKIPPTTL